MFSGLRLTLFLALLLAGCQPTPAKLKASASPTPAPAALAKDCFGIPNGMNQTRLRFRSPVPPCESELEHRMCVNGTFEPWQSVRNFAYDACSAPNQCMVSNQYVTCGGAATCPVPEGTVLSRNWYAPGAVAFNQVCAYAAETGSCTANGFVWPWDTAKPAAYARYGLTCTINPPRKCLGNTVDHLATVSRTRFAEGTPRVGDTCRSELQTARCFDGTLEAFSGSFTAESCTARDLGAFGIVPQPTAVRSSQVLDMVAFGNYLIISQFNVLGKSKLFRWNPARRTEDPVGTLNIRDVNLDDAPAQFLVHNDYLYFTAYDRDGNRTWFRTNAELTSAEPIFTSDVKGMDAFGEFVLANGKIIFTVRKNNFQEADVRLYDPSIPEFGSIQLTNRLAGRHRTAARHFVTVGTKVFFSAIREPTPNGTTTPGPRALFSIDTGGSTIVEPLQVIREELPDYPPTPTTCVRAGIMLDAVPLGTLGNRLLVQGRFFSPTVVGPVQTYWMSLGVAVNPAAPATCAGSVLTKTVTGVVPADILNLSRPVEFKSNLYFLHRMADRFELRMLGLNASASLLLGTAGITSAPAPALPASALFPYVGGTGDKLYISAPAASATAGAPPFFSLFAYTQPLRATDPILPPALLMPAALGLEKPTHFVQLGNLLIFSAKYQRMSDERIYTLPRGFEPSAARSE